MVPNRVCMYYVTDRWLTVENRTWAIQFIALINYHHITKQSIGLTDRAAPTGLRNVMCSTGGRSACIVGHLQSLYPNFFFLQASYYPSIPSVAAWLSTLNMSKIWYITPANIQSMSQDWSGLSGMSLSHNNGDGEG